MWRILSCALILALAAFGLPGAQPALGAAKSTYIVTTTADSGTNSLRWAINQANASQGVADVITFNIPGTDAGCVAGVCTIQPASTLPLLADNAGLTIDGYTQPGAVYAASATPAVLKIRLDGSALPVNVASVGLGIISSNNTVRGLALDSFPSYGVYIGQVQSGGIWYGAPYTNTVSGNFIGVDVDGVTPRPNGSGVGLAYLATANIIGGDAHAERNIISGNTYEGILIYGGTVSYNLVTANYIGLNAAGTAAIPNGRNGVWLDGGAHHNSIGWVNLPVWRNVISSNIDHNVRVSNAGTNNNAILGNYIGTNATGDAALGGDIGVLVDNGSTSTFIGGGTLGQGNLISGNANDGIFISGVETSLVEVEGNWIGLNATGTSNLPNGGNGIFVGMANNVSIGGDTLAMRNYISGNVENGIDIYGSQATAIHIRGNYIGTNVAGNAALPNGWNGISLGYGAHDNVIGGAYLGDGNLISGNAYNGIIIGGDGSDNNQVMGNVIGLAADGLTTLANLDYGIYVTNLAEGTIIGGDDVISDGDPDSYSRNVISGNQDAQVMIFDADNNLVIGNYIGTDITGMAAPSIPGGPGVFLQSGSSDNIVGMCAEFMGNVISGNEGSGISIDSAASDNNEVACNWIGVGGDGETPLGNGMYGVTIGDNASGNTVGNYNTIANNGGDGIYVVGADSDDNQFTRNSIYNNHDGIYLNNNANNDMLAPAITGATIGGGAGDDDTVSGTTCASCWVEVFANPTMDGEGQEYLGRVQATVGGVFTLSGVTLDLRLPYLTATAYRSGDGTSQFSAVFTAPFNYIYLPMVNQ